MSVNCKFKIVSCQANDVEETIQRLLDEGWIIQDMIAENVAVTSTRTKIRNTNETVGRMETEEVRGLIVFHLKK
jgi:hypothetical protein